MVTHDLSLDSIFHEMRHLQKRRCSKAFRSLGDAGDASDASFLQSAFLALRVTHTPVTRHPFRHPSVRHHATPKIENSPRHLGKADFRHAYLVFVRK